MLTLIVGMLLQLLESMWSRCRRSGLAARNHKPGFVRVCIRVGTLQYLQTKGNNLNQLLPLNELSVCTQDLKKDEDFAQCFCICEALAWDEHIWNHLTVTKAARSTTSAGKLTPPRRRKPVPSIPCGKAYDTGTGKGTPSDRLAADASASSVGLRSRLHH